MRVLRETSQPQPNVAGVFWSLGPWTDTHLRVSETGRSRDRLLHRLPFCSLAAVTLLGVSRGLGSPVLAQQEADDVRVALQRRMDQRTLSVLIGMSHLAQRGTRKDLGRRSRL